MKSLDEAVKDIMKLDSIMPNLEPQIDDKDLADIRDVVGDSSVIKEQEDMEAGAVLKATLQEGEGEARPKDGDLVFIRMIVYPRMQELHFPQETQGLVHPVLLGKGSARTLRGVELALMEMHPLERCSVHIRADYAFKHKDCKLTPPQVLSPGNDVTVDLQLMQIWTGSEEQPVAPTGPNDGLIKRITKPGQGWETPRAPFEVDVSVSARRVPPNGGIGSGHVLFEAMTLQQCSLGSGALPPGVEQAVCGMKRGEECNVWVPISLTSGGSAIPDVDYATAEAVSSNSDTTRLEEWIEYSIALDDFYQVRDLAGDGSAVKRVLKKGIGEFPADCPLEDGTIQLHIRVRAAPPGEGANTTPGPSPSKDEWLYDSRGPEGTSPPMNVDTGTGDLPDAVDSAVRLMLKGEVSQVIAEWKRSYKDREDCPDGLREGSNVEFELELIDFEPEPNWVEMTIEDLLARGLKWKDQGNALFKKGRFALAKTKYMKGMRFAGRGVDVDTDEQRTTVDALRLAFMLNIAACAQKQHEYGEAITWCDKAINDDAEHAKAYFRRGVAKYHLNDNEGAREDFQTAKEHDAGVSDDVDKEIKKMVAREKAANAKQRAEMKNFFDKKR